MAYTDILDGDGGISLAGILPFLTAAKKRMGANNVPDMSDPNQPGPGVDASMAPPTDMTGAVQAQSHLPSSGNLLPFLRMMQQTPEGPQMPPPEPQDAQPDLTIGQPMAQQQPPNPMQAPNDISQSMVQEQGAPKMAPETKAHKLLRVMGVAGVGAAAGAGQMTFGGGFQQGQQNVQALQMLPFLRQFQQAQMGDLVSQTNLRNTQARMMTQTVPVTLPNGQTIYVPASQSGKAAAAQIAGQYGVEKTKIAKRFATIPGVGMFDTEKREVIPGTAQGITITPEIAKDYELPQQFVGRPMKLTDLSAIERGQASQYTVAQGAQGPGVVNKVTGEARDVGLGNPRQVQNDIAIGRLSLAQKAFERDTFGTLFGQAIPSSLVDEEGNTMGWKSPSAPTMNEKQQGQQAQDLHILFSQVRNEIDRLDREGKLGPVSGRVSELMTGKIGANDPEFAKLRALGSLTASGMLKAHFGARGGQQMYGHFEALFNTGKMTAGDLYGALDGFDTFMQQYARRARSARDVSKSGSGGNSGNPSKNPPAGPHSDIGFVPIH